MCPHQGQTFCACTPITYTIISGTRKYLTTITGYLSEKVFTNMCWSPFILSSSNVINHFITFLKDNVIFFIQVMIYGLANQFNQRLTNPNRVTPTCVSKEAQRRIYTYICIFHATWNLVIVGSSNGLSPIPRQIIIRTTIGFLCTFLE